MSAPVAPDHAAPDHAALAATFAEARAPRYTSYPTAVHFGPEVDETAHRAWLAAIPQEPPVSLYLHVPFCRRLCWYCGCSARVVQGAAHVEAYACLLEQEIDRVGEVVGRRLSASTVHFGGGSPDSLAPEDLERLLQRLGSIFALVEDAEIAVEVDPAHLSPDWAKAAGRCGINRASLGVQTFAPAVQQAINRPQDYATVAAATLGLRAAGVRSINLDLMYGLPLQTTADVTAAVVMALKLRPERLAVFGYAHVPWMKAHQRLIREEDLPGPAERLEQGEAAAELLQRAGYLRIGLDHFALPEDPLAEAFLSGRLRRNFQGYTADQAQTLIGFGASAISRLPGGYAQNQTGERDWRMAIQAGRLATARGVEFIGDDRLRGEAIERLMCAGELDVAELCRRHGLSLDALESTWRRLDELEAQGLVQVEGSRVRLTPAGRPLVRTICTAFDRYFMPGATRHARAV